MDESADKGLKRKRSDAAVPKSSLIKKKKKMSVEDLCIGDGEIAQSGNMVTIYYIGKLKKDGLIFDSKSSFRFCLGAGHVIKGLDDGVEGMHVGGRRRLTIPPSMGFGASGLGTKIPPDASLVFEVELLSVH